MKELYNISSSPHVRSRKNTDFVMYEVLAALLPVTVVGVFHFGLSALVTVLACVVTAVISEAVFDRITGRPLTIRDGSAAVTGLLLALCLPSKTPLYIPILGAVFAIVCVKGLFGGLGKNFMNPALTARCFLLICFGTAMTSYTVDGVSSATPLASMAAGESVSLVKLFLGGTNGVIGCSILALLIGGVALWAVGGITLDTPLATLLSFTLFVGLFGDGFAPSYLAAQICGGGIVMGAFFMATDPVTTPVTRPGRILFGIAVGVLSGIFRIFGASADSVSYAIIISDMLTPMIDEICIPKPFGYKQTGKKEGGNLKMFRSAAILCAITLVAGVALSSVYMLTKDRIAEMELAANTASYQEVCPDAESFASDEAMTEAINALDGGVYGTDFGKAYINQALVGTDASGNIVGYVIGATSGDGYDGDITISVGLTTDGTVIGIAFTELHETAGMGMLCGEDAFKNQFAGVKTDRFTLNKTGNSTADNEIDTVSGASTSSDAVVNAVNAALDFYAAYCG